MGTTDLSHGRSFSYPLEGFTTIQEMYDKKPGAFNQIYCTRATLFLINNILLPVIHVMLATTHNFAGAFTLDQLNLREFKEYDHFTFQALIGSAATSIATHLVIMNFILLYHQKQNHKYIRINSLYAMLLPTLFTMEGLLGEEIEQHYNNDRTNPEDHLTACIPGFIGTFVYIGLFVGISAINLAEEKIFCPRKISDLDSCKNFGIIILAAAMSAISSEITTTCVDIKENNYQEAGINAMLGSFISSLFMMSMLSGCADKKSFNGLSLLILASIGAACGPLTAYLIFNEESQLNYHKVVISSVISPVLVIMAYVLYAARYIGSSQSELKAPLLS